MCIYWFFYELDFRLLFEFLRIVYLLFVFCVSVFLCFFFCLNINIFYFLNKFRLYVCCVGYLLSCYYYKD